jgi:hypothetical protein
MTIVTIKPAWQEPFSACSERSDIFRYDPRNHKTLDCLLQEASPEMLESLKEISGNFNHSLSEASRMGQLAFTAAATAFALEGAPIDVVEGGEFDSFRFVAGLLLHAQICRRIDTVSLYIIQHAVRALPWLSMFKILDIYRPPSEYEQYVEFCHERYYHKHKRKYPRGSPWVDNSASAYKQQANNLGWCDLRAFRQIHEELDGLRTGEIFEPPLDMIFQQMDSDRFSMHREMEFLDKFLASSPLNLEEEP